MCQYLKGLIINLGLIQTYTNCIYTMHNKMRREIRDSKSSERLEGWEKKKKETALSSEIPRPAICLINLVLHKFHEIEIQSIKSQQNLKHAESDLIINFCSFSSISKNDT